MIRRGLGGAPPGINLTQYFVVLDALAGDRIYVPNQSGDVFVIRASPKFALLACNSVNEPTNSSLAAADGELFLRTDRALWCFR